MARRNRLLDRFPLLGEDFYFVPFRRARDKDWLPPNWEPGVYPKGKKASDNTEAILQWFDYHICLYEEILIPSVDNPDLHGDPGGRDRGRPVRNAYRLVEQLEGKTPQAAPPPVEPSRGYVHYRDDLEAVVAELRKVRDWVAETSGRRGKGGRKPDPEIADRNEKIIEMFKSGKDVGAVCDRFDISADLARKIKSEAGLAGG